VTALTALLVVVYLSFLCPVTGPKRVEPSKEISLTGTYALFEELIQAYRASRAAGHMPMESVEGHIGKCGSKVALYRGLVAQRRFQPHIQVCEIGFNFGHSAITWLSGSPNVHLQSFDLGEHKYAQFGKDFIVQKFGANRFDIVFGNSKETVPEFFRQNPKF
jgi:hypothetical protein